MSIQRSLHFTQKIYSQRLIYFGAIDFVFSFPPTKSLNQFLLIQVYKSWGKKKKKERNQVIVMVANTGVVLVN
ncbi:Uncharacterized protein APZ42_002888 [Daphnia magna]|uniref:Uncharacterized protein n=1 Tax=Daphnia magna TaxID=35525 RepID=A0A164HZ28_9CRUS|nr:Uncharacterized protein APZ42_002888 [Daphnia magna]